MTQPLNSSRRRAMKTMAGMLGLGLSASQLNALAAYNPGSNQRGQVFDQNQWPCAQALANVIIPATATPGAGDIDVHAYVDHHLSACSGEAEQRKVQAMLSQLDHAATSKHNQPFAALADDAQIELTKALAGGQPPFDSVAQQGFAQFKPLVVFGYYTSELGATQELNYLPIPGGYDGDYTFAEAGKAWSLQPFV